MDEKKFICIMCPLGCEVTVKADDKGGITEILGNKCEKGAVYAKEEYSSPKRVLTSTVGVSAQFTSRLPIRTSGPIPVDRIFDAMNIIHGTKLDKLVASGKVIIKDLLGLGVDVIATKDML